MAAATDTNSTEWPSIRILSSADVLDTLGKSERVKAVVLDPWYNKGIGGSRLDYNDWLAGVIRAACAISSHVFVWGFPEIVAPQVSMLPKGFRLQAWLTWYYKNCPSRIRGWRSAQNACLHICAEDSKVYPEHFMNGAQLDRLKNGKMRFIPGPPTVFESPLNIGFVGKKEQTGHPAQKPLSVIKPLILMSTKEGDTVLDPMCGSGTTGEACFHLNRNSVLCDVSSEYLSMTQQRMRKVQNGQGK